MLAKVLGVRAAVAQQQPPDQKTSDKVESIAQALRDELGTGENLDDTAAVHEGQRLEDTR